MSETPQRGLHIHFMDGSTMKISFPVQENDLYRRKLMMEEIMKRGMLMIEADGGIHCIPLANIKYMSIYPAAEHADVGIIKGAQIVE
jgi:hypothetical protein